MFPEYSFTIAGAAVATPTSFNISINSDHNQQHLQPIYTAYKSQPRPAFQAETFS